MGVATIIRARKVYERFSKVPICSRCGRRFTPGENVHALLKDHQVVDAPLCDDCFNRALDELNVDAHKP